MEIGECCRRQNIEKGTFGAYKIYISSIPHMSAVSADVIIPFVTIELWLICKPSTRIRTYQGPELSEGC